MAVRISSSLGSGFSSSSARAVISMPGVQKPQCSAWHSWKPCWIGSSTPSTSSASTVRTSCPAVIAANVVHDFTGLPSICTTQAPQLEVSQPQCVPVRPGVSRMKCTSSVRGSTSRVTVSPLMLIETSMSDLLLERAGGRAPQRAPSQHPGEVALVVDGTALVGDGVAVLARDRAGLLEQLLRRRLAAQELI